MMIDVPPSEMFIDAPSFHLSRKKVVICEKKIGKRATTLRSRAPRSVILLIILPIYLEVGSPGRIPGIEPPLSRMFFDISMGLY